MHFMPQSRAVKNVDQHLLLMNQSFGHVFRCNFWLSFVKIHLMANESFLELLNYAQRRRKVKNIGGDSLGIICSFTPNPDWKMHLPKIVGDQSPRPLYVPAPLMLIVECQRKNYRASHRNCPMRRTNCWQLILRWSLVQKFKWQEK